MQPVGTCSASSPGPTARAPSGPGPGPGPGTGDQDLGRSPGPSERLTWASHLSSARVNTACLHLKLEQRNKLAGRSETPPTAPTPKPGCRREGEGEEKGEENPQGESSVGGEQPSRPTHLELNLDPNLQLDLDLDLDPDPDLDLDLDLVSAAQCEEQDPRLWLRALQWPSREAALLENPENLGAPVELEPVQNRALTLHPGC